ncbi:MAG: SHOCT domain-containing protein [Gammaproteobacteria bacterium]
MNTMPLFRIAVFCCAVFAGPVLAGGLFGGDDKDMIWQSGNNLYFKYAKQDKGASGPNSHPVVLDATRMTQAFQALQVWKTKSYFSSDEQFEPVFSIGQTRQLGEYLAAGLRRATPQQDIIFVMQKSTKRLLGLKTDHYFVAGRAFYQAGKLNIIIGDYNKPRVEGVESVYDPTHVGITKYTFKHGSRSKKSGRFKDSIHEVPGITNKQQKDIRTDWFVIDIEQAAVAYQAAKVRDNPEQEFAQQAIKEEADKSARERREMRLELARMRKQMQEAANAKTNLSVEDRLQALQELRDKELITEEEYQTKRKEILDDI